MQYAQKNIGRRGFVKGLAAVAGVVFVAGPSVLIPSDAAHADDSQGNLGYPVDQTGSPGNAYHSGVIDLPFRVDRFVSNRQYSTGRYDAEVKDGILYFLVEPHARLSLSYTLPEPVTLLSPNSRVEFQANIMERGRENPPTNLDIFTGRQWEVPYPLRVNVATSQGNSVRDLGHLREGIWEGVSINFGPSTPTLYRLDFESNAVNANGRHVVAVRNPRIVVP